jgi:hypothetical protein
MRYLDQLKPLVEIFKALKMKYLVVIISVFFLFSCKNDAPPPPARADQIALSFCNCTAQLSALNAEAANLKGDTLAEGKFLEKLNAIQMEYEKTKVCAANLKTRFGALSPSDFVQIEQALNKNCPQMGQAAELLRELFGE